MSVGGVGGGGDMAALMNVLMQGMQKQSDLCMDMVAIGVENSIIGTKMDSAQQIIDEYA